MARIRSIKPELPHSESMGRISRDSRLTFILLFTLSDDVGRLRGNSRMLASLLYPYDEDSRGLIDGWLDELEREGCIQRYSVDGAPYLQICNWLSHQKIDRPTPSKLPSPAEKSRAFAKPREGSSGDLDLGSGSGSRKGEDPSARAVPRGTSGVIPAGNQLTQLSAIESVLEDVLDDGWRRDVPECNPEAFTRWIVHCESRGKQLGSPQRLYQARQLAGNGSFADQKTIVDYCIGKPYYSLIPIKDVRSRLNGMTRDGKQSAPAPMESDELRKLVDRRASIGLSGFRMPNAGETAEQYRKAQDHAWNLAQRDKGQKSSTVPA